MRAFWLLVGLRLREVQRSGTGVFFFVVLPVMLMGVVGVVFINGHPFERHRVAVVGAPGPASRALEGLGELRLDQAPGGEREALGKLMSRELNAVLVEPAGPGGEARVLVGPRDKLLGLGMASSMPVPARVEVIELPRWGYVHFLFPGMVTFSALISGFFGMGYPMVRYRQALFLKKLATTPLPKGVFIGAQMLARTLLTLGQVGLMVAVGRVAFDLPFDAGALPWLLVLSTLGVLVFMGAGFLLACFVKTEAAMVDAINVVTLPFVFLSEIFFPADQLPGPLPLLASALPSTQLVRLLRAVLLHGQRSIEALGPGLALIGAWTLGTFALSVLLFRWHE